MDMSGSSATMKMVAEYVPFAELSGMLSRIEKIKSKREKKRNIFHEFLGKWKDLHKKVHNSDLKTTTDSFYPAMRLLFPQLERERTAYGIKEVTLAKLYIEILGLAKDSPDAKRLLNYRAPSGGTEAGDFAMVAHSVLKDRLKDKGSLSIGAVNNYLDGIAKCNAEKNREGMKKNLLQLLHDSSAIEQKWLVRIIMKDLKVGLTLAFLKEYHPDAEEYYNVTNDLKKVCQDLYSSSARLNEISISLFSPFRPMLGERFNINNIEKLMKEMDNQPLYLETKLDGERLQLHKRGNDYKYFSRNGHDYTKYYGSNPLDGSLTPHIAQCFKRDIYSCILDGEVVAFSKEFECFVYKGSNNDIKWIKDEGDLQVCLCLFDCLKINERNLANIPLKDRIQEMKKVFEPVPGRMLLVDRTEVRNKDEVVDALNVATDRREEGIVLKIPNSTYQPNKRQGSGWLKIKPEYVSECAELDLIILGGYFGRGRRSKNISQFLCGVAVPPDHGDQPRVFHSFCKVGSGYTYQELADLNKRLVPHFKPCTKQNPPPSYICLPSGYKECPEVWIEPKNSIIIQVKGAEIMFSKQFQTSYTVRFPRLEKVREDKSWYECMTTTELEHIRQKADGKLFSSHVPSSSSTSEPAKKRTRVVTSNQPTVPAHFRATNLSDVTVVSRIFDGKEFCVINGPKAHHPKAELEHRIVEHGGSVVQNPDTTTYCVIANKNLTVRVKNIISNKVHDVVSPDWLLECFEEKKALPWLPNHMVHKSPKTADYFNHEFDEHEDSYTIDSTLASLKHVFNNIGDQAGAGNMTAKNIAEIETKYFADDSPLGLFRTCIIYLDRYLNVGDPTTHIPNSRLDLVELELRFYSARVTDQLGEQVTHVVFEQSDLRRLAAIQDIARERAKKHHLVTTDWVYACIDGGTLRYERAYLPLVAPTP